METEKHMKAFAITVLFACSLNTATALADENHQSSVGTELTLAPAELSACHTADYVAGPIWNHDDAQIKCPAVCSTQGGTWTGHWVTIDWNTMSVSNCTVCW
jgi:hypothetical protein